MISFLKAYRQYDPATQSLMEVLFLYPGVKAVFFHRLGHVLYRIGVPFVPRMISEFSRWLTGIEIHPGATIGKRLVIDHGMGLVIGQTAVIGDDCILFHGVTLGGTKFDRTKRHPTLGHRVVVGAGAKILGNISIGNGVRVGANSVVVQDVPDHTTVAGIPAKIVSQSGIEPGHELEHGKL